MERTKMPHYYGLDQEMMVFMDSGILFSHKEERNFVFCRKMYGTGEYHLKGS
jgi:hypothetical protein